MNNHDEPCTGEPARPAVAYIGTAGGLFVAAVLSVDFYADDTQSLQRRVCDVNPSTNLRACHGADRHFFAVF